jgi:hypothetical protein
VEKHKLVEQDDIDKFVKITAELHVTNRISQRQIDRLKKDGWPFIRFLRTFIEREKALHPLRTSVFFPVGRESNSGIATAEWHLRGKRHFLGID